MSPRGSHSTPARARGGQRTGSTGVFGDRISRHTAPGDRRHPTRFATWISGSGDRHADQPDHDLDSPDHGADALGLAARRTGQPERDHEADAESDAKRAGPRVVDRLHGRSAYCSGFQTLGASQGLSRSGATHPALGISTSRGINHLAGLVQVIGGEAPAGSRPGAEVLEVPGAELAPVAVVGAVDGAGRAEAGCVVAARVRAACGRGWIAAGRGVPPT
jgi:hypothetical protein